MSLALTNIKCYHLIQKNANNTINLALRIYALLFLGEAFRSGVNVYKLATLR